MADYESKEKPVEWGEYCKSCINRNKTEEEDPCFDCLNEFSNTDTHRPVYYKKDETI